MLENIKYAIFDMDGTLIDSLMLWDVLWEDFGERFLSVKGFRPEEKDDKAVRTMTLKDAMDHIHSVYNIAPDGAALLARANDMMREFYAETVQLKPGVREFLDTLRQRGVVMCVASATATDLLKIAMKHCELEKYFDKIFSCSEIGKGKDHPDIYFAALDHYGATVENTVLFEDSLTAIQTAVDIGLPTVAIYDKYNFGQETMKKIACEYISDGETLMKLINK